MLQTTFITYWAKIKQLSSPKNDRFDAPDPHWFRDPLAHPDIRMMTLREIADLPIDPYLINDQ